ncbi:P-loop containing nucleoside triphosphate hydrolase protein [Amanita muscaria]
MFQVRDTIAQLEQKDCITISLTGSGKTLTFWIPLLFNNDGIIIIVTALNILGDKNVAELEKLNISASNITGDSATDELFKEIEAGQHRVIVVSPEKIMKDNRFRNLWNSKNQWGNDFRPEYGELGRLRWLIPSHIPFHVVSATMPTLVFNDVKAKLMLRPSAIIIHRSNDRPNISFVVEKMQYSARSMLDLKRVLQLDGTTPPKKFMVFVNKRRESEEMAKWEWENLLPHLKEKIVWFHSGMSPEFHEDAIQRLQAGEIWGLMCTDAAGLGLDITDIEIVIQWRYVPSLCTLAQRMGRGARKPSIGAIAIYLVKPKYFDGHKKKATSGNLTGRRKRGRTSQAKNTRKKAKTNQLAVNQNNLVVTDSESEDDARDDASDHGAGVDQDQMDVDNGIVGGADGSSTLATALNTDTPIATSALLIPSHVGLSEDEYEFQVMDAYINAKARAICRRKVCDAYFGNDKCKL